MKILSIDTSRQQATAAIVSEYITIGEILLNARTGEKSWTHSEILMPGIDQLFKLTRLTPEDIDYVAYTCGPGSFTGLRIGAATAVGIATALKIQAIPVPTLDALAYNVVGTRNKGFVIPMLDARRGQVYTAIYGQSANSGLLCRESEYMALPVEEAVRNMFTTLNYSPSPGDDILFLGDGADANEEVIRKIVPSAFIAPVNNNRLRASSVGVWAMKKILEGHSSFSDKVDIIYVRVPQAVREAKKA